MDAGWAESGGAEGWGVAEDDSDFWDGCEVVVRSEVVNQRLAGVPLEGSGAAAVWHEGRLIQWISTQNAHGARNTIARAHGLDADDVRVITPDVGGGFGPKINPGPESVVVGWLARRLERPVTWTETRGENLVAQSQGRGHLHHIAIGGRRDGTVLAYELDVRADSGAYPLLGSFLPQFTRLMASGVYDIPRVRTRAESAVTSTVPTEAYRGAGRPEAAATIERAMDLFAAEVGIDPVEVRRRNLIPPFTATHETASGAVYDCGDYGAALEATLAAADYDGLRREQSARREQGRRRMLGIGVSMYVEITGAGMTTEYGGVSVRRDTESGTGIKVRVLSGSSPHGQGLHTALAMIASDRLGLPMGCIEVHHGDTDLVPSGLGTMGSRSLQMGGSAVWSAAADLVAAATELAAEELGASVDDVVLDAAAGGFKVAGAPGPSVSWVRVVELAEMRAPGEQWPLTVGGEYSTKGLTFPDGCHLAVVEVDADTGLVELIRLVACDDAGRILNPMLAEGQRQGGIAQGVSQVLFEAVRYDDDGNPLTATLADYGIPSAPDLPAWDLVALETPTPMNPLGAKGIGESGTIGATPAVQSAVIDSLAPLGIRHVDLPLTPERVWLVISEAMGSEAVGSEAMDSEAAGSAQDAAVGGQGADRP
jgi:carbon-monoxide dehydrogenase large subunit